MVSEWAAYLRDNPAPLIFGGVVLLIAVPTTLMAIFSPPPKRASFTLDWRQRAALAWSGPAVLGVALGLNLGRYPSVAIVLGYIGLWVMAPDYLRKHLGERADRKTIERGVLAVQAGVTVLALATVLIFQVQDFNAWRVQQQAMLRERAMAQRLATYAGFPDTTSYAVARILLAEKRDRVPQVGKAYFDSPCDLLRFESRNWFLCYGPDRKIASIAVATKVLGGQGLSEAARDDARLLLWVVTGQDRPAQAERLARALYSSADRRPIEVGDVTLEGRPVEYLSFRTSAWRTGAVLPDTSMISTYTY
jgi:hypothetical protein